MLHIFLLSLAKASQLSYPFTTSVGQLVQDSSGNNFDGVLGSTLLTESNDAILTDRGAYFNSGTRISVPPNAIHPDSLLPITNTFLFVITFKVLGPGCLLSITNGATTKLSAC